MGNKKGLIWYLILFTDESKTEVFKTIPCETIKDMSYYLLNYNEIPPVVKVQKTRWGDDWTDEYYPTLPPLLEGKIDEKYSVYAEDSDTYTWLCYAEVDQQ